MAGRYQKFNAEYYPHFVLEDDRFDILILKKGYEGYGIYHIIKKLICNAKYFIYKIPQGDMFEYLAVKQLNIQPDILKQYLDFFIDIRLFNREIYEQGYLFSVDLVDDLNKANLFKFRESKPKDLLELAEEEYGVKVPSFIKTKFRPDNVKREPDNLTLSNELKKRKEKEREEKIFAPIPKLPKKCRIVNLN